MLNMANSKYERVIAIATAVCMILLGIAFIVCTAHLYFTGGERPFSAESVGRYLKILIIPSLITIALAIAGFVLAYVNKTKDNELAKRTSSEILEGFKSRFVFDSFDEETKLKVRALKKRVNIVSAIAIAVSVISAVISLVYILLIGDFTIAEHNSNIISALALILPLTAISLAIYVFRAYLAEKYAKCEYDLLKASIKEHGIPTLADDIAPQKPINSISIAKCVILCVAAAFVVIGIFNGGMADVLGKAIRICTECIGLG